MTNMKSPGQAQLTNCNPALGLELEERIIPRRVSSPVDLLIMQALCWVHDDLNQVDISSYVLKVCGQEEVLQNFEKYYLMCALTHNNRNLFKPVQSKKVGTYKSFFYHIKWDELINFPISVSLLPLEAMLSLSLYGVLNQNANNSPDSNKQRKGPELLGKVSMPLFDFRRQVIKQYLK
ncbi:phosphatidylinositol 4-phosphate 3-kinase C2 domain-containing subunit alpha-like protein [Labeo rohita]|uniref:Phosphatidylinositol 4-phosphate 3-kinase C2 domain-containing subunit alpha-like protein n=1 Tax=Labeo rohita TaxID=84645 RepID=A0A498NYT9_LABRO|nr:phosphatidylinositol 4-phosphate 3-kinase C2 domain-containing subunit alpha-like protein [Labeo rohita]